MILVLIQEIISNESDNNICNHPHIRLVCILETFDLELLGFFGILYEVLGDFLGFFLEIFQNIFQYKTPWHYVTHDQITAIFKTALELVLEEERIEGVKTINSGATNAPINLLNLMTPKRQLDEIADSQKYSAHPGQHIPPSIIHSMPIHVGDLPRSVTPLRKRVWLG